MNAMDFPTIVKEILSGKRVTKLEWDDKRSYGVLQGGLLQLHKAGESKEELHPWIINDGDLGGTDWIVID